MSAPSVRPSRPRRAPSSRPRRSGAAPRILGFAGLLAACALADGCGPPPRPGFPPRHLLLVTMGAARADHLSAYLYPRPTTAWPSTPQQRADGQDLSLDDMAVQGVLFAEAFTPSPRAAVAAASLLTGRSPWTTDLDDGLPAELPTLAEAFRDAGFETAAFLAGAELAGVPGLARGFDEFADGLSDVDAVSQGITWSKSDFGDGRQRFLWLHLDGPNAPYGAEPIRLDWPDGTPGPLDWVAAYGDPLYAGEADGSIAWLERAAENPGELSDADRRRIVDLYDAGLSEAATLLRRYLVYLEQSTAPAGLFEETAIAFCGLTGEELFEHGGWGHGDHLCEEVLRVPLFLRHPASLTGSRILTTPVESTDLFPTLCEWFEVDAAPVDGRSLLALTDSYVERTFAARPAIAVEGGALSARIPAWRARFDADGVELEAVAPSRVERVDASRHADVLERIRAELASALSAGELTSDLPASARALSR